MPKLLLHNLSISFKDTASDIFSFDQMALFFSEAGDTVVTRRLPNRDYLKFLSDLGLVPRLLNIIVTGEVAGPYVLREKPELVRKIFSGIRDHTYLDTFMPSFYEEELAKALNLQYPYAPSQYERFVSKNAFRVAARKLGLPIPAGYEYNLTKAQLLASGARLFLLGAREIVVKQDDGVSGNGMLRIKRGAFLKLTINDGLFPVTRVASSTGRGFVVEKWIEPVVYRPSVQVFINASGVAEILSIHDQTMRSNGVTYSGCRSQHWLPDDITTKMREIGVRYAQHLAQERFQGHFSVGAVVDVTGNLYLNELNPRRVISSYPCQIIAKLGFARDTVPYAVIEVFNERWLGLDVATLLNILKTELYDCRKGRGVIPFDLKFMAHGQIMLMVIGLSISDVEEQINMIYERYS